MPVKLNRSSAVHPELSPLARAIAAVVPLWKLRTTYLTLSVMKVAKFSGAGAAGAARGSTDVQAEPAVHRFRRQKGAVNASLDFMVHQLLLHCAPARAGGWAALGWQ